MQATNALQGLKVAHGSHDIPQGNRAEGPPGAAIGSRVGAAPVQAGLPGAADDGQAPVPAVLPGKSLRGTPVGAESLQALRSCRRGNPSSFDREGGAD